MDNEHEIARALSSHELAYIADIFAGDYTNALDNPWSRNIFDYRLSNRNWIEQENVIGFGVGFKNSGGTESRSASLKVYVKEKLTHPQFRIPKTVQIAQVGNLVTDVEESRTPDAQGFDFRQRPIRPGSGISHKQYSRGTATALVKHIVKKYRHLEFMLSCQHVLFPHFRNSYATRHITQPSTSNLGTVTKGDVVARQFQHAGLKKNSINQCDAAIGQLKQFADRRLMNNRLIEEATTIQGISDEFLNGDFVEMYGASSGKQRGRIVDLSNSESFNYWQAGVGIIQLRFNRIVKCKYRNSKGDSGAPVILSRNKKLVGIHFGGNGDFGFFCRIKTVFSQLGLTLPA